MSERPGPSDNADPRQALRLLIERMYGWRGLNLVESAMPTGRPDRITLVASESGHAAQSVQSGKVNQYGALLFGAAAVAAVVLVIVNV